MRRRQRGRALSESPVTPPKSARDPQEAGSPQEARDPQEERRRRLERRRARARSFDTTVPSPCIAVCQIDDATGCCIGCFRDIDEIRDWPIMTAEEKQATLARIDERKAAAGRR